MSKILTNETEMTDNLATIGNLRQNVVKREYVATLKSKEGKTVNVHFSAESESAAKLTAEQIADGEMIVESVRCVAAE